MSRIYIEQGSTSRQLRFVVRDPHGIVYDREMSPRRTHKLLSFCEAAEIDPEELLAAAERFKEGEVFLHPEADASPDAAAGIAGIDMAAAAAAMPSWGDEVADDVDLSEPEADLGPAFPASGSNVLDHILAGAGVRMPPMPAPGGDTSWASVMGGANGEGASAEPLTEDVDIEPFEIRIRGRYSKAATATRLLAEGPEQAIYKALEAGDLPDQAVVEWAGTYRLACLDLDWHHGAPPTAADLDRMINLVSPWPALYWRSHGGGAHLIYHELEGFSAEELAASAAIAFLDRCPVGQRPDIEILSRTAHPDALRGKQKAGSVYALDQSVARLLDGWRQGVASPPDEGAIREWLGERALEMGRRYDHTHCPFDPRPTSGGGSPVVVTDMGVMCYVCKGKGHRSRGFKSFSRLCGAYTNGRVLDCAEALVFFEHARHLLLQEYPAVPEGLLKPAWSAFLKLCAGEAADPRVPRAMTPSYVVRGVGGVWLDSVSFRPVNPKVGLGVTMTMPSAMYCKRTPQEDGTVLLEAKIDAKLHDLHRTDQRIPGFPEIVPVPGLKLWGQHNEYPGEEVRVAIPPTAGYYPACYVEPVDRKPVHDSWAHIEKCFPGVDRAYLELLIVARGFAEAGSGPVPMIMVTGPTGAAKSTTVLLAAALCGDVCAPIKEVERERFQEAIGQRARTSGFLLLDEFGKDMHELRRRALFSLLLDITRTFTYRANYTGPTYTQLNSTLVLTNNAFSQDVKQNAQLGRRLIKVDLCSRAGNWETTCGTRDVRYWRTEETNADAANSFVSHVIDKYLPEGCNRTFIDAAGDVGFKLLEELTAAAEAEGAVSTSEQVRELFTLVCAAPAYEKRPFLKGWKVIDRDDHGELAVAWRQLCDDPATKQGIAEAMRIAELDLGALLGVDGKVKLETTTHGRKVGLRFIQGHSRGRGAANSKFNEEIVDPNTLGVEAGADQAGPDVDMGSFTFPDFAGEQDALPRL